MPSPEAGRPEGRHGVQLTRPPRPLALAVCLQGAEEGGAAGRKRDFAAIAGQDSLMGPGAPIFAAAGI